MKEHKDSAIQNDRGMKNMAERTVQAEPTPLTRQSIEQLKEINSALAIQVLPMGIADRDTVWALVDQAIQAIDRTGLSYTVGPFETVVEGPLDQLLELASTVHRTVLAAGAPSVATYMKLWSGEGIGTSTEKTAKYRARGH